jgi:protein-S-isoprenylcysteine O-methyltransferase Ste14
LTGSERETSGSRIPSLGSRGQGWVALQFGLMGAIAVAGYRGSGGPDGWQAAVALVMGAAMILCGLLAVALGVKQLDRSLSALPKPIDSAVLIEHGLYRRVRHPIYAGVILGAAGWSVLMASVVALLLTIVLAVVLDLKSRREEAWLRERYPEYVMYAARTKRFVPYVY